MPNRLDGGGVVITGASAGIGRALARLVAQRAGVLTLVARRRERLDELARELAGRRPGLDVRVRPADLADRTDRERLLDDLEADGPVDVLINNAGVGDQALLEQADWRRLERLIEATP